MAPAASLLDYSVPDSTLISRSDPIDPFLRQLFEYLSLGLTPDKILKASDKLRESPREDLARLARECHRHSTSLSSSERSSLISSFSRLSSASSFSAYSQEPDATEGPHVHDETSQGSRTVSQAPEAALSPFVTTNTVLICFSCNKPCSTQSALKRHQDEKCERKVDWTCPVCQWTGERLIRHYAKAHGDRCSQCFNISGERVCDDCGVRLSRSYQSLPRKQAWGCPYCTNCFRDFDSWNKHCTSHYHQGATWSWPTMIFSLLQQFGLPRLEQYNWTGADWIRLNEKTGPELRDDLQRLRCPKSVRQHQEHNELRVDEVLIRYTHRLLTIGPLMANFVTSEIHQQANISLMPPSRTQETTYFHYQDMRFPVPPSSTADYSNGQPEIGQELQRQTLPFEVLYGAHNLRPDSATIPQPVRLPYEDIDRAPQTRHPAQFSRRTQIVTLTPISGDGFRRLPNGQSTESSRRNEKYTAPYSNADALQMLCRRPSHAKVTNLEAMSGSQSQVLPETCTSSEAGRTVSGRVNAEHRTDDTPVTPPQTLPMSDVIFQQYCSYPTSSPEPEP